MSARRQRRNIYTVSFDFFNEHENESFRTRGYRRRTQQNDKQSLLLFLVLPNQHGNHGKDIRLFSQITYQEMISSSLRTCFGLQQALASVVEERVSSANSLSLNLVQREPSSHNERFSRKGKDEGMRVDLLSERMV
jgi:hypothetical protein